MIGIYGAGTLGRMICSCINEPCVFIDDFMYKSVKELDEKPVYSFEEFIKQFSFEKNIIYICIYQPGFSYLDFKKNILKKIKNINIEPFTKILLQKKQLLPFLFFEEKKNTLIKLEEYENLRKIFKDSYSLKTLDGHINLRITGDFNQIQFEKRYTGVIGSIVRSNKFTYVDVGAFDGDTAKEFILASNDTFESIHLVEPDLHNLKLAMNQACFLNTKKIFFHNFAISNISGKVGFESRGNVSSSINSKAISQIDSRLLNELNFGNNLFIKLDIEGCERDALDASKSFIKNRKPSLAVSVYHKPDDLIEIAKFFHNLDIGYKLLLRCHGYGGEDLMIYAFPDYIVRNSGY